MVDLLPRITTRCSWAGNRQSPTTCNLSVKRHHQQNGRAVWQPAVPPATRSISVHNTQIHNFRIRGRSKSPGQEALAGQEELQLLMRVIESSYNTRVC